MELGDIGVRTAEVGRAGRSVAAGAVPRPPLLRLRRARLPERGPVAARPRGQGSEARGSGQGRSLLLARFLLIFGVWGVLFIWWLGG